jgi:tripartite ATP-independent transporter DctP family solute receptor
MNIYKAILITVALLFIGSFGVSAEMKLTVAETHLEDQPTTQGLLKFAALVKERSNGEIIIEVKFDGILGKKETELVEQIQAGALDMARFNLFPMTRFAPAFESLSLPYIWDNQASMWNVLKGETGQKLLKALEAYRFYGLCYYEAGAQSFYNAKREIKKVEDLKGLTFRVQRNPIMIDLLTMLGANPVPMVFSEVYDAMDKGVIDGAESSWQAFVSAGHYELAKYYTLDAHTSTPEILIGSKIALDKKLKPEQLKLVKQAAQDTQDEVIARWNAREEAARKIVLERGQTIITELTPEAHQGFFRAVQPLYDKYGEKYKALIKEIRVAQQ